MTDGIKNLWAYSDFASRLPHHLMIKCMVGLGVCVAPMPAAYGATETFHGTSLRGARLSAIRRVFGAPMPVGIRRALITVGFASLTHG